MSTSAQSVPNVNQYQMSSSLDLLHKHLLRLDVLLARTGDRRTTTAALLIGVKHTLNPLGVSLPNRGNWCHVGALSSDRSPSAAVRFGSPVLSKSINSISQ